MLHHSRLRLQTELHFCQMLLTQLRNGLKFKLFGPTSFQFSLLVILQRIFQLKLNFSKVLTRFGLRIWKEHSRQRMLSNAVKMNYLNHHFSPCKLTLRSARNNLIAILNKREEFSHVSISVQMQIYLRFFHKVQIQMPSSMILKNCLMQLTESHSMNKTED